MYFNDSHPTAPKTQLWVLCQVLYLFISTCMFDLHSWQPEICHRTCQVRVWKAYYACKQSRQTYDFIHAILHTALLPWTTLHINWTSPRAVVLKNGIVVLILLKFIAWQWQENIEIFERLSVCGFRSFVVLPSGESLLLTNVKIADSDLDNYITFWSITESTIPI